MKLNAKDVASGIMLVVLAVVGLWLNMDHTLGSARRMGPGYMPMLVFWLQLGLGAIVLIAGLFSGPDPLEKWTKIDFVTLFLGIAATLVSYPLFNSVEALSSNWYGLGVSLLVGLAILTVSPGWRVIGVISAAMTLFGLLLDTGGLFLAIAGTILVAAFADRSHRPLGVAGLIVFLIALCWWVFIKELDIRVAIWPTF
ncbi:tripartite tricarboxylate transporter TctB family protein [Acetobacteraceae bacterium H6797]|nr:tripartite tricarboxylate transporter TctB family protein [Acetobacteraceae bacterium H6797]